MPTSAVFSSPENNQDKNYIEGKERREGGDTGLRIILLVQKTVGLLDTAVDSTFFNSFKISEK